MFPKLRLCTDGGREQKMIVVCRDDDDNLSDDKILSNN